MWALAGVLVTVVVISSLAVVPPLVIRQFIDVAIPEGDLRMVTLLGIAMIGVPLISASVGVAQRWLSARVGEGIIFDLRRQLYEHLQRMSMRFFTATKTGELVSRLSNDVVGAQQAITGTFVTILSNFVSVIVILAVMFGADWRLTLLALAALPLFILPARRVARILRRVSHEQMERDAAMSAIVQETFNVSGALLVKLFGRERDEADRFGDEAAEVRDLGIRRALIGRWFFAALGLVSAVGTATVFWVGGLLVIRGEITLGTVVMFSTLLVQLYGPLAAISNSRVEFATSLVSFERVFQVLDLPLDLSEVGTALELAGDAGELEFRDVWFTYTSEDPEGLEAVRRWGETKDETRSTATRASRAWALRGVSFEASTGQLVALVGPSGAGKTTISYLIPRLYDVSQGSVRIDGIDVRELALSSVAAAVGVVTQETYLFHSSVEQNLRYAQPEATQRQIEAACRAANIHEVVATLPDAYETVVGERGYRLSGGEKQRIAIARAILKDPQILILDEATSHLDSVSEALIQEALEHLLVGRTSIVIAHRLSTVRKADKILVLDDGQLIETGDHAGLLAVNGLYAHLYETQFRIESEPAV